MLNREMFNFKKNDEYYTPRYVIKSIIPFLKEQNIKYIWCPADTVYSEFAKVLKEEGFFIRISHIQGGWDFLKQKNYKDFPGTVDFKDGRIYKPDLILTNPPFSLKNQFIEKANELGIPFMYLLGLQVLNYKGIAELMRDTEASLIYLIGSRISYDGNTSTFQSSFITNLIKSKIVYVDLNKEA